jgi:hypothetical protein
LHGQSIAPQLWNNLSLGKDFSKKVTWINTVSYNVLLSSEFPWDEITINSIVTYRFHPNFMTSSSFYVARTKQYEMLSNWEVRPVIGFMANTNTQNRFFVSNYSRFEYRWMFYSNKQNQNGFRFRNLTLARVSLNKKHHSIDNSFSLFGYVEFFSNPNDISERFVQQIKYKLGITYRLNYQWRFNCGLVYQQSTDNIPYPSQLPTNLITNYIFDWAIVYFLR